jgi:hypothetical protein
MTHPMNPLPPYDPAKESLPKRAEIMRDAIRSWVDRNGLHNSRAVIIPNEEMSRIAKDSGLIDRAASYLQCRKWLLALCESMNEKGQPLEHLELVRKGTGASVLVWSWRGSPEPPDAPIPGERGTPAPAAGEVPQ